MQSVQAELSQQDNNYSVSGSVDFSTVPDLARQLKNAISSSNNKSHKKPLGQAVCIDLSAVTDCNSAGLAMMFDVLKSARSVGADVHFKNIPVALLTIAKAYGVDDEINELNGSHKQ